MKNRSTILREIYAELRNSLPRETSSREIITLAHGLLKLYLKNLEVGDEYDDGPVFEDDLDELSPAEWPVDMFMNSDSWDINRYEEDREIFLDKLEQDDPELIDRIKTILNLG
ncbi:hypothetical protein [Polynucleobacter sp. AM-7D1]|uniref:hypothetical protein n=1 Tax=Polynucleobacter sp. AM-7D1 TaxID=2689102 RepID=UPI001BFCFEF9|nr:hypothetical protein [Polynucleobacter sp. AM-7D1]QWE27924.1 hypothetical protein GQ359_05750 [Polynucleobacter sp. AM-7D1]